MIKQKIVAVLGAGNMGTAIAQVLAENGHVVQLWNWEGDIEPLEQIKKFHVNKKYLPGVKLSHNIVPCFKIAEAVQDASVIFFVVPSGVMEHTISFASRNIKHNAVLVNLSKGINHHSCALISEMMIKHVTKELKKNIVCISGPAIAKQISEHVFTAMSAASKSHSAIKRVKEVLENKNLRLVETNDLVGVELGGSFKNVYAIAMGIADALNYGLNTKAALVVSAIKEMADLIQALGGKRHTAYQLSGLGDLVGTALCDESRNRLFGEYLGKGLSTKAALKKVGQTVEGVEAVYCLRILATRHKLKMPFAFMVYEAVVGNGQAKELLKNYLATARFDA
ncbi:MAG: Glycerol-3-phosphate dehydrogenase [NAD(P)+] [Candidatus Magasanikbacteria bacterium GW2011_GWC2_37_14]|uniref:Glycerol-3-phosphate dehydrogenase [NAD(P)+] n=1 Tax=Candidatus Magasanikbacteria bacterium GW2011_GWC2_37_14 TaxID=1619046 RepID=A0A0G0GPZ2_9BACT|nr:MAG: Glycerol-3-phosphate dehydrogenase [NAD(P)+] [Candidatus Magasanikbacteria bacterium GW2011_GWC2_37_14]